MVHVDTPNKEFMQHALMQARGLDPSAAASEVKECDLMLRKSQQKVDGVGDDTFGLVASSLPYKSGYLNQQFVMLLSELGISDEVGLFTPGLGEQHHVGTTAMVIATADHHATCHVS